MSARLDRWFRCAACSALLLVPGSISAAEPSGSSALQKLSALFDDPVVARGKGVEVKRSQLEEAYAAHKANLAARGQTASEAQRPLQEALMLDRLIVTQILTNRVAAADQPRIQGITDSKMSDSRKNAGSEEELARQLKAVGLTPAQFEQRVREQAVAQAVVERELKSKVTVADADVKDFYASGIDMLVKVMQDDLPRLAADPNVPATELAAVKERIEEIKKANLARLEQPEKVRVSHVLLAVLDRETEKELPPERKKVKREQAERLRQRALAGEDFAKLVLDNSEDRNVKETKGEYTFSRHDRYSPEFKSAAFSLTPGQISEIVTTMFGYHIIKLHERIPAKKVDLEKVAPEIKDLLTEQKLQRLMPEFFTGLKKDAALEILDPKYRLEPGKSAEPRPN